MEGLNVVVVVGAAYDADCGDEGGDEEEDEVCPPAFAGEGEREDEAGEAYGGVEDCDDVFHF